MFQALERRQRQEQTRQELLVGILASVTANYSMGAPREPCSPRDFMPSMMHSTSVATTDDQIAANINAMLLPVAVVVN